MSLPEKGWTGYGRPGVPDPAIHKARASVRALKIQHDNASHALREVAFARWCRETVFPASVNRLIEQIGASVR